MPRNNIVLSIAAVTAALLSTSAIPVAADSVVAESVAVDSVVAQSVAVKSVAADSVVAQSFAAESVAAKSVAVDSVAAIPVAAIPVTAILFTADSVTSLPFAAAQSIDTPSPAMTYPGRYVKAYTNRVNAETETLPDNAHPSYAPPVGGTDNTQTDAGAQTDEFTAALIDCALDEILSTDECFVSERQYIDASPDAFLEITALGERALPYLESIASGADEGFRPYIAMAAMYKISPELYDREFVSPDGRYTLRAEVYSFYQTIVPYDNICYRLRLVDNATGEVAAAPYDSFVFADGIDNNIGWSPDSKYVSVTQSYRHSYTVTGLLDTSRAEYIQLPHAEQVEDIIGKPLSLTADGGEYDRVHFRPIGWGGDRIYIRVSLGNSDGDMVDVGWYSYDISDKNIDYIVHIIR